MCQSSCSPPGSMSWIRSWVFPWAPTTMLPSPSARARWWPASRPFSGVRRSLFWTLLGINLLVVGVAVGLAALMIGRLADAIFASLMKEFHIQADIPHHMFATALWHSLLVASLAAGGVGVLLSVILFGQVIRPVRGMMAMAGRVAGGDYGAPTSRASAAGLGSLAAGAPPPAGVAGDTERS